MSLQLTMNFKKHMWTAPNEFKDLSGYPEIAIEYVVLHELAHLIEPSHNARFKSILSHNMPDWKEVEGILNHRSQSDEQSRV